MTSLSNRIQSLRKKKGISQGELARLIGVSRAQMNRYESQGVEPAALTLKAIADHLDTTADFLINGSTNDKAEASLKDNELLKHFKDVDAMPENDKNILIRVISAFVRDFKTKQAYAS
jgi:transcriptional regulator with XRE-family HTH domain